MCALLCLSVMCDKERCNPSCKGELQNCRVNSLPIDRQKCGSYPAEPSLVICASLFRSQLCSPLHCHHPSLCSQCQISPAVTLCPFKLQCQSFQWDSPTPHPAQNQPSFHPCNIYRQGVNARWS